MWVASGIPVWRHTGLPAVPLHCVLPHDPQGLCRPRAPLFTDPGAEPTEVLGRLGRLGRLVRLVRRWPVEVTLAEPRGNSGPESQRQWLDAAIACATPALLGLFSLVALRAREPHARGAPPHHHAVRDRKQEPTFGDALFSDALGAIRRSPWAGRRASRLRRPRPNVWKCRAPCWPA